jgi:capsular polysaccharide biosynthesis protein
VVLLVVLGLVGAALGFSLLQTPVYEASAKLVVATAVHKQDDRWMEGAEERAVSLPDSRPVAEATIQRLGLLGMEPGELLRNLAVEQLPTLGGNSFFIRLSYRDTDPRRAMQVVNTVGEVSSERLGVGDVQLWVWGRASEPTNPVSPKPLRNAIVALGAGLVIGIGLALLLEQHSRT